MDRPSLNEPEHDTLIMDLVDSALARAGADRQSFLETVLTRYPELYEEVKDRVSWEDRMGGFLREPVLRAATLGPDHPFAAGELVNGRFRIQRELGRGGMGVVYEARDEKLQRRIAIKCGRREFQSRMTPEARAALEVSHPNVCKLHELHTAQTAAGPVDFLTMEFVEGETLFDRLEREGAMPEKEMREVALQICAGLAQAHRQRVIHGDIKAGNVILGRTPEGRLRAVVTDFGLAKLVSETPSRMDRTQGGTLAFMAPELLAGALASAASDIYALGMLFNLMLTGKLIVRKPPDAPVKVNLPAPWSRIVSRCLEVRPEDRFASVDQVTAVLTRRRAVARWALAAALLVIAILGVFVLRSREETGPSVRLVVLPVNVEGAPIAPAAGLGVDVADRLSGARRNFTVIGPQEAVRNRVESVDMAKSVLGATHVLRTTLRQSGSNVSAAAVLADAATGHPVRELKGDYPAGNTALIAKALIGTVTGAFGLHARIPKEPTAGPAYQDYVEGVALLRRGRPGEEEALLHFANAARLDPQSALPYAGSAEVQLQKLERGEDGKLLDQAGENVAKARSLNPDSVPVLLASGFFEQMRGRYEPAITNFNRATQLEPQNADAWRRLAMVYEKSNRNPEAIATYQKAIEAQPDYYSHYLSFGTFYLRRGEFTRAEELYRRATAVAPALPSAHMNLGLALMQQGRFEDAEAELLASLGLRRSSQVLLNLGAFYYSQERFEEAVRFFEESIAVGPATAVYYRDLGDGYRQLKRKTEATRAYNEGRRRAEAEVSRNPRGADARVTLALQAALLGDRRQAELEVAQALAFEPENTMVLRNAAITYEVLGERDKALAVLRSVPQFVLRELNRQPDLKGLGKDPRFRAMFAEASNK